MTNALRFIRFSFRCIFREPYRPRHTRSPWPRIRLSLGAGLAGAALLLLPVWLALMGVI
jgi:hypothetical protein